MPDLHSPAEWLRWFGRNTKRLFILLIGVAILAAGVAMLALPGPGVLVIVVGLVVLATEFAWAERALDHTTRRAAGAANAVSGSSSGKAALALSGVGMIAGGIVIAVLLDDFVVVGISIALAGVIGLCTLHPTVQAWIAEKAAEPDEAPSTMGAAEVATD